MINDYYFKRKKCNFGWIFGIISSILTISALIFSISLLLQRKNKNEDKILEEYLNNSIQ